ncbi:hypothetical protein VTO42DRAFT_7934 [Malbranchea cinnamomea]
MASVSSLDRDLRDLRLSRYTPQAANEARVWIEEVLHEKLPSGDLLDALKDGVVLCKLVNLAIAPPAIKYRESHMPFVQMENISHFLHACQMAPLSLPPHDVFLTVDLYEAKDPAQVLQCLGAFSRRAHELQPAKFPRAIGKSRSSAVSPQLSGSSQGPRIGTPGYARSRGVSNASQSGQTSPSKSPRSSRTVSAWSNKAEEDTTMPAWNIHQYGYLGGANQSNMGVSFGARRQITTPSPSVPSLAEKERRRREAAAEEERRKEEAERQRRLEREAEEARAREEEERLWEEETRKAREEERRRVEEEKRRWDEEKKRWEEEERQRQQEEKEAEERLERERLRKRELADSRLNGQFLSQYQASNQRSGRATSPNAPAVSMSESERIRELERQLELARERERQYERERQELARARGEIREPDAQEESRPAAATPVKPSYDLASMEEERKLLRSEWQAHRAATSAHQSADDAPPVPPRSLPEPPPKPPRNNLNSPPTSPRPLPNPHQSRTDRFLASNPAPEPAKPASHRPQDYSSTAEIDAENARRVASTRKTRAGGWASKTLLEREMERERERQREWEENQRRTKEAVARGVNTAGTGPGEGAWDVHQYGYLGGDNQNKGGTGIGFGARRQIVGPRPPQ